jgi:rare lipoprotein A
MNQSMPNVFARHGSNIERSHLNHGVLKPVSRAGLFMALAVALAACGSTVEQAEINNTTKFKSQDYGVSASERVTVARKVQKGGGTYKLGNPYQVAGRWFYPQEEEDYDKKGRASWYGPNFHGRLTANGEIYDQYHLSAAHPTFPLPSYARVTNLDNGHSVVVRVNDRGPFTRDRIIDVSSRAADMLEMKQEGVADVRVEYVGLASLDGQDMSYLMASFEKDGQRIPAPDTDDGNAPSGVMLAMSAPKRAIASVFGSGRATAAEVPATENVTIMADASAIPDAPAVKGGRLPVVEEILLPDIGPVPRSRPSLVPALASTPSTSLASYAQMRVTQQAETPFGAILTDEIKLTGAMIAASWKKRHH